MPRGDGDSHQAAVGLHQELLRGLHADSIERVVQAVQVTLDLRADIGVDDRGREAGILAYHGQHFTGQRDADAGRLLGNDLRHPLLVGGVEKREQQADGDRLHALALQLARRLADFVFGQRCYLLALEVQPSGDLLGQMLWHQERRLLVRGVDKVAARRLHPALGLVGGAEASRDEQAGLGPAVFQQRIRAHRRPVREEADVVRGNTAAQQLLYRRQDRLRRIGRIGRHLGQLNFTGVVIERHQIGEGSTGIHTNHP